MKKIYCLVFSLLLCLSLASCTQREETKKQSITSISNIEELKGYKIAAQTGTFHQEALKQVDGLIASDYKEFTDLLVALKAKTIDGYIAEEPTAYSATLKDDTLSYLPLVNNENGFKTTDDQTGIAIALKKGSDLLTSINSIIDTIDIKTQNELMKQMIQLTASEDIPELALKVDEVTSPVGTLKVAMECAYEPYNWTLTDNNSMGCVKISGEGKEGLYANGYDVQVARYIASKLNMNLEVYAYEWDSLLPAVESGVVDMIVAGMSPTEERRQQVDFTSIYYNSNLVIIINKD